MLQGKFTFDDFLEQLRVIKKMGSLKDIFEKLPFFNEVLPEGANLDDGELVKIESMIHSMTRQERRRADLLENESRMKRIARGAGRTLREVQDLYVRFKTMRDLMGALGKQPGLLGRIPGFKQMGQLARIKNMDMGEFFGSPGGMPALPKEKKAPIVIKRMDPKKAKAMRKALKKKGRRR